MNADVFVKHRSAILGQMKDNSIMIICPGRKNDEDIFKQTYNIDRNYYYLCGLFEYENIILLSKVNGNESEMIFINPYDDLIIYYLDI